MDTAQAQKVEATPVDNWQGLRVFRPPLRQSSLGTRQRCRRLFMYTQRLGLVPKRREFRSAISLGNMTHRLLQLGPEREHEFIKETQAYIGTLEAEIEKGGDMFGDLERSIAGTLDNLQKARLVCRALWRIPLGDNFKVLGREVPVRVTVEGVNGAPNIDLAGTLDEVIEDTRTEQVWIRDHKSTSQPVEAPRTGYQYSFQCRLYRLLAARWLKGKIPVGMLLSVLQVPGIKMCSKDCDYTEKEKVVSRGPRKGEVEIVREYHGEPRFENYLKRCEEWYAAKEAEGSPAAVSYPILYDEEVFAPEFWQEVHRAQWDINRPIEPLDFPRDQSKFSCYAYGKQCPYYSLCCAKPSLWGMVIEKEYDVEDPDTTGANEDQEVSS